jgi:CRP-like cAMP-binding protein
MDRTESSFNHLLARLPREARERLERHLEPVRFERRDVVYDGQRPIEQVVFPTSCVASLIQTMEDGSTAEAATVGNEGMTGVLLAIGSLQPLGRMIIQLSGEGLRTEASRLQRLYAESPAVQQVMQRFMHAFLTQLVQSTACNQFHSSMQRCARWLATMRDRTVTDQMALTHEFLAEMLGVRRATVTHIIDRLQSIGAIEARHGRIIIADRERLEEASCECYRAVKVKSQAVYGAPVEGARR